MATPRRETSLLTDTLVLSGPLLLTLVAIIHPTGADLVANASHHPDLWLTVHVLQLPLFGLVALSLFFLAYGRGGLARGINLLGVWLFLVFYTAMDTLAGIASGVLATRAQDLPSDEQQVILDQIPALSADFSAPLTGAGWAAFTLTVLGGLGWVMATIGAAVVLRTKGIPLGACILVGLGALYFMHDMPTAPFAAASLLLGTVWAVVHARRRAPEQAG